MTLASRIENEVAPAYAPVRRWPPQAAEHDANFSCSASCYEPAEHIVIFAMIVAERELRQIERQILLAYLVIAAHDAAFKQRPEPFDVVGMYIPANVFVGLVVHVSCGNA